MDDNKIVASNLVIASLIASGGDIQLATRKLREIKTLYKEAIKELESPDPGQPGFFGGLDLS